MILSFNHLKKYLPNYKLSTKDVEYALNELGIEVETVTKFSDVEGLVFAKVLDVYQNPESDRLDIVKLLTKNGEVQIQTNNRILKPGDLTICFPVGAKKGDMTFNEVVLKGHKSQGMMAAWSEIGYDWELLADKNQVLVLPNDFATIEDDAMAKLGLDDYLIEISTTANRNDANSYYIIAKELAAFFETDFVFEINPVESNFESNFKLVNNEAKVDYLSFVEVKGNKETSLEDKMLLAKHNISSKFAWSINLTNLCLIEIGAPAHVYDASKITDDLGTKITSDKFVILGNKEVEVKDVLTICDSEKNISLACVMGLENTKTEESSNDLLFEIGVFDPKLIRHGAKEIKLNSNSSNQGSRVITPEIANLGINFIRSYCNGLAISQTINPINVPNKKEIQQNDELIKRYANINDLSVFDDAKKKLTKLDFEFIDNKILVPNYRYDVEIFEDIIEEIFRFYSYKNFEPAKYLNAPIATNQRNITKEKFTAVGFSEVRTFTLVSKEKNLLNIFDFDANISLMTYVSKEREQIRNSIITSMQEVVEYNQKRKMTNINIFEKGMVNNNQMVYGLASTTMSFLELKQVIINFLDDRELEFKPLNDNQYIHPNVSAYIHKNNELIGWIGKIHPLYDQTNAFYAEFKEIPTKKATKFNSVDNQQLKTLDLTFSIDLKNNIGQIIDQIKQLGDVFEIIQVDNYIKQDQRNVTLRITANEQVIQTINNTYNK
ncbi:phenylalanine--tRNA ligase subunit beta [Mycoplasma sp. NEAQ87857]|uniref:phenylalanine--tRNA ligase subunit beta n=1 Tax=Mycoplasma sp. NEAQ87857 TaxID=2683967 RepID=UPI001318A055|nr:phenylalanine--tRNA ligase subunit beta [Mycoplasma sp. NEAQ87857]QGZ97618.1 phenylalanine--tRNA ligase subunit beta [Mycoplasma sp. NEAQ87857]